MSEFDPLFSAAEQKYGLPPGILKATAYVESKFDPSATSPTGVRGLMQINGANAKHYGGNRLDPAQSVDMAGRLWSENMKATGGDIDASAVRYNGGGDPHYVAKLHGYLSQQGQAPSDPIEAALTGSNAPPARPAAAASNDPIELALSGAHGGGDATSLPHGAVVDPGNQGGGDLGLHAQNAPGRNGVGDGTGGGSGNGAIPAGGPTLQRRPDGSTDGSDSQGSQGGSFLQGLSDFGVGTASGVGNVIGTGAMGIGWGLDKLGVKPSLNLSDLVAGVTTNVGKIDRDNAAAQDRLSSHMYNPEGWAAGGGRLAGNIAATLPAAELKVFQAAPEASAFVRGLARYGNYGVQGAAAGAAVSGGHDVGANIIEGAALGPVGGAIGEHILGPVASKAKSLAAAIRGTVPEAAGEVAPVAEASTSEQTIRRGGETADAYRARRGAEFDAKQAQAEAEAKAAMEANPGGPLEVGIVGGRNDYVNGVGDPTAPLDMAAALKAHGARNGIEATQQLPAKVADHVAELKASGVPDDHALNEASIRYVGGNPTVGAVTRERATMQAEKEGAKVTSPEGSALAARAAENNAALHDTVQETVNGYGGVPAQGEASQAVAESLAKASDAAKAKVSKLYDTARTTDGEAKLNTDTLRELLKSPEMATPTSPQVQQLANGIRSHLEGVDASVGTTLRTPAQLEDLRQLANSAYDNMGGPVNGAIRKVGGALNDSLDQLDSVSGAYKTARAAHRDWASQYADPEGVSRIISRDAGGNFLNEDNWRRADNGLIGTTSDRAFAQVTRQLHANGDTQTLDRLRAEIVQRAYQRATNSAADESGNPVFSAKQWHTELNKIGMPKLKAVFSKDEIAHLATVGRAARALHESVPGTVNASGTSAALINALSGAKNGKEIGHVATALGKALKVGGHVVSSTIPMGHVAVEGVAHVAGKVSGARSTAAANKALAKAIRHTLDPAAARVAANENAAAEVAKSSRKQLARGLARHTAPAAAASQRNR